MSLDRRADDIEYTEYFLRKTIQPNSLRTPTFITPKAQKNAYAVRKNFPLYLNKQTRILRETQGKDKPIRELFSRENNPDIQPIFPNAPSVPEYKIKKHQKQLSLPNDKVTREVINYLESQECRDFFVVESAAKEIKKKDVKKPQDKEMTPDQKIKLAILSQLDDRDINKYFKFYSNDMLLERLKDFRSHGITKRLPIQTFFTAPDEEVEEQILTERQGKPSPSKFSRPQTTSREPVKSTLGLYIMDTLKKNAEVREKKVLEEICKKNNLSTKRLLNVDENIFEGNNTFRPPQKTYKVKTYESDDIQAARLEAEMKAKEIKEFKKNTWRLGVNTDYRKEFQRNLLSDQASLQRMRNLKFEPSTPSSSKILKKS